MIETGREEYGANYGRLASVVPPVARDEGISISSERIVDQRGEVQLLGAAGRYNNTAGEIARFSGKLFEDALGVLEKMQ